jgi:hypothetical protein
LLGGCICAHRDPPWCVNSYPLTPRFAGLCARCLPLCSSTPSEQSLTLSWVALAAIFVAHLDRFLARLRAAVAAFAAEDRGVASALGPVVAVAAAFAFPLYSSR